MYYTPYWFTLYSETQRIALGEAFKAYQEGTITYREYLARCSVITRS